MERRTRYDFRISIFEFRAKAADIEKHEWLLRVMASAMRDLMARAMLKSRGHWKA